MRQPIQPQIPGLSLKKQRTFGGSQLKSHPKEQRAIPLDKPLHLVMRAEAAKGQRSFLTPTYARQIFDLIQKQSERFNVRLYRYANAGNHLHMVISPRSRRGYAGFVRSISGLIARLVLHKERGRAGSGQSKAAKRFWDARPFTRIVSWGRDFAGISRYIMQNTLEAVGFVEYRPRGKTRVRSVRVAFSSG